ncbi:hypothetical protein [Nocardia terpenica]|uniref:Uncharacterized protein n=1 Tax=Nocardia terpenica TaxID=455432 RepID=A0A6G9Z9R1_9NOCA|nr:hypothetical protein [Nocardia terpenica]QIS22150.1 hypothetical protein F6W96_31200 [Nocardia terpenica]
MPGLPAEKCCGEMISRLVLARSACAEDCWDEGYGIEVFRRASVCAVVGADVVVPVVVDGLDGEQPVAPVL